MGATLVFTLTLAACGGQKQGTPPSAPPASPAVQKIYDGSCRTCHSNPASGAPQAGDVKAWSARVAQGREVVLGHVINGYNKMPPMGLCMQCSEDDFAAVTAYMAGAPLK